MHRDNSSLCCQIAVWVVLNLILRPFGTEVNMGRSIAIKLTFSVTGFDQQTQFLMKINALHQYRRLRQHYVTFKRLN